VNVQNTVGTSWRDHAACRGLDPEIFFPGSSERVKFDIAMSVCGECPVRTQCLDAHLMENEGIWGGTSGKQRKAMRSADGVNIACHWCGKSFLRPTPSATICSAECRLEARRQSRRNHDARKRVSS
jgi:WhiB family redox-sensing transcriptional regulator